MKQVGPLIRYIVDGKLCKERVAKIESAVHHLGDGDKERRMLSILEAKGMSEGTKTIPGTLFSVAPQYDEESDEGDTVVGYDGEHVKYRERVVTVATDEVYETALQQSRRVILTFWGVVDCDEYAKMGRKVENLFASDLESDRGFVANVHVCRKKTKDPTVTTEKEIRKAGSDVTFSRPSSKEEAYETLQVLLGRNDQAAAMPEHFPVIDAAGPGRRVYQVTVSKPPHSKSVNGMVSLLLSAGLLQRDSQGNLMKSKTPKELEFYWVVPPDRFAEWTGRVATKYSAKHCPKEMSKNDWRVFQSCFEKWVVQHVLEMPYEPKHELTM